MYAGNLLIYASDYEGENADMTMKELNQLRKQLEWLENEEACEAAFSDGRMDRPSIAVNGEIVWQWGINEEGN